MSASTYRSSAEILAGDARMRAERRRQLLGGALVTLSAVAIAIVPTLARFAYDGGSDTLTVTTTRSVVSALSCFLLLIVLKRPLTIARKPLVISMALGILYAVHLYALLEAVHYLPVNIVIIIFYLHPLIVGVFAMLASRERMGWKTFGALAAAFVGLGLAIGFSFSDVNMFGIALALMAAVIAAALIIGGSHAMRECDSLTFTSYMMLSAAIVLAAVGVTQGMHWPVATLGWLGCAGVAIAYTIGTTTFFAAIPLLGAVRAAMISNLEPVLGILFAMAILGESVSILQGLGIATIIGSIFAMEAMRQPAPAATDRGRQQSHPPLAPTT
jgi:drug/metabolite transporter (DMT)-like permease